MGKEKNTWSYVNKWYLILPLAYIVIFFVAPLIQMFRMSLYEFNGVGKALGSFTWDYYKKFLLDSYYWRILGKTVGLSFLSAIICAVAGYPIAYHLCRMEGGSKHFITALVMLPLWVPITVRLFGLMTIIPTGSLLSIEAGLVYCGLPYMIIILTGPIGNVNKSIEEASYVFGAGFWTTFFKITFPLTIHGLISGFMLVFALNTAAFVVPVMLGAGKIVTMTTLIYQQATYVYNWGFASAIAVIFMVVTMLLNNSSKLYDIWLARRALKSKMILQKALNDGEIEG